MLYFISVAQSLSEHYVQCMPPENEICLIWPVVSHEHSIVSPAPTTDGMKQSKFAYVVYLCCFKTAQYPRT